MSPPSSQPAAWLTRLAPPITAPHSDIPLSYAAWASTVFEAVVFDERKGSPYRRASCPLACAALVYSGVPKAGLPLRMSTFDVNEPYTAGTLGARSCTSVAPASISEFCSTSAPASVTGAIAPASVNGVMHTA